MRPLEEARRDVIAAVPLLPAEPTPLDDALGLVLADDAIVPHDLPPFTNSAMDGYAVRAADVAAAPAALEVLEDVPAGSVAGAVVLPGTAIKIMTGAPMPEGADAVVRVEDTEQDGATVRIGVGVGKGTNVRPAGGDVRAGEVALPAGRRLTPAMVGVLASIGTTMPVVHRRPRVAVMSTGDEVLPPEADLRPGAIRDSNRPILRSLLAELGAEVVDLGIIGDDANALRDAVARGAAGADAIITSGGVSMGEYDLVKQVLGELGSVDFWQVAMQPGKPFAFGHVDGTPLFGLPGNPVSVTVAFEQFARPALLTMMGSQAVLRPRIGAITDEDLRSDPAKTVFLRAAARREGDGWRIRLSGGQLSNMLSAVAVGDAFVVMPRGIADVPAGGSVIVEMFRWPEDRPFDEEVA
ncbi:MAG: molybdopterin molybdotransferase MoeA [Acidimicrobiia bacterium]|nr:molybdopterin molybdotransferase MoeA [Acidimicrobiia bacterium]